MEKNKIYTISHGAVPIPSKWIIPGLTEIKGNLDAFKFVIEMVCEKYEQTEKAVMSKNRKKEIIKSRHIIMALIKNNFPMVGLKSIGNRCGGKDHATVLHATKSVTNQVETNRIFREEYQWFDNIVKGNIKCFRQTHYITKYNRDKNKQKV
jgi:chromosomal replication initiator protein